MTDITDCYFTALTNPDAFFAKRLGTTWAAASDADQTKALQMATAIIDNMAWQGHKLFSTQSRAFPRKYDPVDSINPWGNTYSEDPYGYIYDSDDVPQAVLDACCLVAQALLADAAAGSMSERVLQEKGVSSFSQGKLSVSFVGGGGTSYGGLLCREAYDLLSPYMQRRGDIR